jgi:hypothetical protein
MTIPALLFGFILATLYGVLFHLWRGGGLLRLFLFIVLSWSGFWIGNAVASHYHIAFAQIGPLNAGLASFTSGVCLLLGYWLSLVEVRSKRN